MRNIVSEALIKYSYTQFSRSSSAIDPNQNHTLVHVVVIKVSEVSWTLPTMLHIVVK